MSVQIGLGRDKFGSRRSCIAAVILARAVSPRDPVDVLDDGVERPAARLGGVEDVLAQQPLVDRVAFSDDLAREVTLAEGIKN